MAQPIITLNYRQAIDAHTKGLFEQNVFNYSYEEFLLKSQAYNPAGELHSFTELKKKDGRANSLHYKCSFAVGGFVSLLDNSVPGYVDAMEQPVRFDTFKFELLESHTADKLLHKLALHYVTAPLRLLEILGDQLLLSKSITALPGVAMDTFMVRLQPGISIVSYLD